jgi:hypothetical protein
VVVKWLSPYETPYAYVVSDMGTELAFRNVRSALKYCIVNGLTCPIDYKEVDWAQVKVA